MIWQLGVERRRLVIFQEGFGWVSSPRKLCRVDLMYWGEKRPWLVDFGEPFIEDLADVSDLFDYI